MRISSDIKPEEIVIDNNGSSINYNIVEEVNEEVTSYIYSTIKHPSVDIDVLGLVKDKLDVETAKAVAKEELTILIDETTINISNLSEVDPLVSGMLWKDGDVIKVSTGDVV